jgi:hypothetical protein
MTRAKHVLSLIEGTQSTPSSEKIFSFAALALLAREIFSNSLSLILDRQASALWQQR